MPDRTPRPSTRRRPHVALHKGLSFGHALRIFNARVTQVAPVATYVDARGRRRHVGKAAHGNALTALHTLARLQRTGRPRSGVRYIGYAGLGREFGRSRSTAYRAVTLLVLAELIIRDAGDAAGPNRGGKTTDEQGNVVPRANGYQLHPALHHAAQRQPRKGKEAKRQALGPLGQHAKRLGDEFLERQRDRARDGPAA